MNKFLNCSDEPRQARGTAMPTHTVATSRVRALHGAAADFKGFKGGVYAAPAITGFARVGSDPWSPPIT